MGRACVIGAGSSGIASCQALHARGIPFDCFEAGSEVGGNWRYDNDNGMSSAYLSLQAKSSRRCMQYAAFPMPEYYPDYLSHELIAAYLDDCVDHSGFRDRIQFRTEVTRARPAPGGGWDVTVRQRDTSSARTERYDAVLVANGHHWDPQYPEPAFPGAAAFTGEQIHSRHYRTPEPLAGKRVLILGIGNSACDIAAECSQVATRTLLAMRRGAHIVPKYLFGRPTDHLTLTRLGTRAPVRLQSLAVTLLTRIARGKVTRHGLPRPDRPLLHAPPTVSDSLLGKLDHGAIAVKPSIDRFAGDRVHFTDGSAEPVDVVIYCTGYKISFPFLDEAAAGADGNHIPLYRRVVPPRLPGLYFIGLVQPVGAVMPIAEIQSEWVADLLEGRAALPPEREMNREIARYHAVTTKRYGRSARHAIQVDFLAYLREIRRERRAGARRGAVSRVTAAAPSATRTPPPSCTGRVAPELAHHLGRDGIVRGHLGEQDGDGAGRCRDVGCGSGAGDPAVASRDVPWIDGLHIRPGTARRMGSARGRPALRVRISS
jgi:thioredoxin reductase